MIGTSEAVFSMGSFSFLPLEFSLSAALGAEEGVPLSLE